MIKSIYNSETKKFSVDTNNVKDYWLVCEFDIPHEDDWDGIWAGPFDKSTAEREYDKMPIKKVEGTKHEYGCKIKVIKTQTLLNHVKLGMPYIDNVDKLKKDSKSINEIMRSMRGPSDDTKAEINRQKELDNKAHMDDDY